MPRLYHRKSLHGCRTCKRRKVKCDETKPKCGACTRHNVCCEYSNPPVRQTELRRSLRFERPIQPQYASLTPPEHHEIAQDVLPKPDSSPPEQLFPPPEAPYPTPSSVLESPHPPPESYSPLELRLLHHFVAFTSFSFSPASQVWQILAPQLAFRHRFTFDAIMALSALHLFGDDELRNLSFPDIPASSLRQISLEYLNTALRGYQEALRILHSDVFEAAYLSSSLVSLCILCRLGDDRNTDVCDDLVDEAVWVKLAMGTRQIVVEWKQALGKENWRNSSVFTTTPDLVDEGKLFNPENRALFEPLLEWTSHYITLTTEERQAYEHTLSYIGLLYSRMLARSESAQESCHRIRALPARVPRLFGVSVVQQQPLALTILAYVFAMMKLLEDEVSWFSGIAERQVFAMQEKLPLGWRDLLQWPMQIASGIISRDVLIYFHWQDCALEG